jgi:hypothetical protein
MLGCYARLGAGQGIGNVIVQYAPTGSHPPNATRCLGGARDDSGRGFTARRIHRMGRSTPVGAWAWECGGGPG